MRVKDIMNTKITYLKEEQLLSVKDILSLENIRNIPVIDNNFKLTGLITYRELIQALTKKTDSVKVRDIMLSDVKTVTPDTPLKGALEIMILNKFGCLPVVDSHRRLMGIITEIDLIKNLLTLSVKHIMNPKISYLKEDQEISVLDILNSDKIRNMPVVNEDLKLVGILSYKELVKALATKKEIFQIKEYMTKGCAIANVDTPFSEAVQLMIDCKYGCLPIVNSEGRLVGIITEIDLLRNLSGITPMPADFYAVR